MVKMRFDTIRSLLLITLTVVVIVIRLTVSPGENPIRYFVLLGVILVGSWILWVIRKVLRRRDFHRYLPILEIILISYLQLSGFLPLYVLVFPFSALAVWINLADKVKPYFVFLLLSGIGMLGLLPVNQGNLYLWFLAVGVSLLLIVLVTEKSRLNQCRIDHLETNLKNKNALLSTLSHEIRTPLTVIQSTVDVILEERTGPLTESQMKFLESTASNVRRLITLSENILASIKVESSWFNINMVPLNIRKIVILVAHQMEPILDEKDQNLKYSFPKWLPRPMGDETWIQQVLINLIHNASKHLGCGGTVLVSVMENELCIVVSVSDDGTGMMEADRIRVFGEFFQGEDSVEREINGFGLGLTIVKKVIEKHGGKVYVGSVEKLGTTVSFTLPRQTDDNRALR